ncbi:hypothetical protein Pelo_14150 [Pelomyxa schiedti]|nr:hypothetical protein Pelo_14150 [Pelomyxa schiedti]
MCDWDDSSDSNTAAAALATLRCLKRRATSKTWLRFSDKFDFSLIKDAIRHPLSAGASAGRSLLSPRGASASPTRGASPSPSSSAPASSPTASASRSESPPAHRSAWSPSPPPSASTAAGGAAATPAPTYYTSVLWPEDLYLPCHPFPRRPWVLALSRGVILLHALIMFWVGLGAYEEMEGSALRYFIYNTNWSYILLLLYFAVTFSISLYHTLRVWDRWGGDKNLEWHPSSLTPPTPCSWYHKLIWVHYETCWTASWTVSVLFWVVLKGLGCLRTGEPCFFHPYAFHGHGINALIWMNAEMVFTRIPFIASHVIFSVAYIILWLIFSVVWHSITMEWAYDVQDPAKAPVSWMSTAFYPGFIAGYILVFYSGYGFERLLRRLYKKPMYVRLLRYKKVEHLISHITGVRWLPPPLHSLSRRNKFMPRITVAEKTVARIGSAAGTTAKKLGTAATAAENTAKKLGTAAEKTAKKLGTAITTTIASVTSNPTMDSPWPPPTPAPTSAATTTSAQPDFGITSVPPTPSSTGPNNKCHSE